MGAPELLKGGGGGGGGGGGMGTKHIFLGTSIFN